MYLRGDLWLGSNIRGLEATKTKDMSGQLWFWLRRSTQCETTHTGTRLRSTGSGRRQNDRITREFLDEVAIVNPGYVQEERESSKKSRTR